MEALFEHSRPGPAAQLDVHPTLSDWYSGGYGFDPPVRQHFSMQIGHKIISTAILSLPLVQVGQLSVTGRRMRTK